MGSVPASAGPHDSLDRTSTRARRLRWQGSATETRDALPDLKEFFSRKGKKARDSTRYWDQTRLANGRGGAVVSLDRSAQPVSPRMPRFSKEVQVKPAEGAVIISLPFELDPRATDLVEVVLHWGKYAPGRLWSDEEVLPGDIHYLGGREFVVIKEIHPREPGLYGVAAYARAKGATERHWRGEFGVDDARFEVDEAFFEQSRGSRQRLESELRLKGTLLRALSSYKDLSGAIEQLSAKGQKRGLRARCLRSPRTTLNAPH